MRPAVLAVPRTVVRAVRHAAASCTAVVVLAAACADSAPLAPASGAPSLKRTSVTEPTSGPWARVVEGETGPGALYSIHVPRSWNGSAVHYAHGFRNATDPVSRGDQDSFGAIRDQLGALGYAVAFTSYSANGFAVKEGAQGVHQLRGRLASALGGQPTRSYLLGHSLGAGISLSLVDQYANQYDGALLMCGMVGGSLPQTQYLGHVRALFDRFYPGVAPGSVIGVPPGATITLQQVVAAVQANPLGLYVIASTAQTPLPWVPIGSLVDPNSPAFQTLVGSLFGALQFQVRGINDIVDRTSGHVPFDNASTTYTVGTPLPVPPGLAAAIPLALAAANADVARYSMDPAAENYLSHDFTPSGDLRIPVLTVHNAWDPGVPAFHEQLLLQKVQAAGATGMLLQRFIPSFGHCNISAAQAMQNFGSLVQWVESGQKPAQ